MIVAFIYYPYYRCYPCISLRDAYHRFRLCMHTSVVATFVVVAVVVVVFVLFFCFKRLLEKLSQCSITVHLRTVGR